MNRWLSSEIGPEGQWDTTVAEYQREPMDAILYHEDITIMKSARCGGSQIVNNQIAYCIDQLPGPFLYVQTGLKEAREWSKDEFDTMVRDTPCLREKVGSAKIKDRSNEILHKKFHHGILSIIGGNSPAGFRRKTIQRVWLDDIDGYESSAGEEGDPIALAKKRTQTFFMYGRSIVKVSTPTIRELSKIEREFFKSDQRHYFVPCPKCNFMQLLIFSPESQFQELSRGSLKFEKDNLTYAWYECENCHEKIDEKYKTRMVRAGKWRATKPEVKNHAGFHISEMVSPFSSWMHMAKTFLDAKRSREELKVFINQSLGETFTENKLEVDADSLMARREQYKQVPEGVLVLTAGVDVQDDRLEAVVMGWGKGFESWFIDRRMIIGSPQRMGTWSELDDYLAVEWIHANGQKLKAFSSNGLNCICIDSGYSTEDVYRYVKSRQSRRFFATKGDEGFQRPFIIDVKYEKRMRARFAMIAVDEIKLRIYDRLALTKNNDETYPPGFMHFNNDCNQDFFDQLTSEKLIRIKTPAGYPKRKWVLKDNRRNEVLDCVGLNFAAVELLKPNFDKLAGRLRERIEQEKEVKEAVKESEVKPEMPSEVRPQTKPEPVKQKQVNIMRRRGGWNIKI